MYSPTYYNKIIIEHLVLNIVKCLNVIIGHISTLYYSIYYSNPYSNWIVDLILYLDSRLLLSYQIYVKINILNNTH